MTINIICIKMNVRRMALFSIHAAAFHGILRAFFECEEFVCRAKLIPQEKWLFSDFPHARRSNLSEWWRQRLMNKTTLYCMNSFVWPLAIFHLGLFFPIQIINIWLGVDCRRCIFHPFVRRKFMFHIYTSMRRNKERIMCGFGSNI